MKKFIVVLSLGLLISGSKVAAMEERELGAMKQDAIEELRAFSKLEEAKKQVLLRFREFEERESFIHRMKEAATIEDQVARKISHLALQQELAEIQKILDAIKEKEAEKEQERRTYLTRWTEADQPLTPHYRDLVTAGKITEEEARAFMSHNMEVIIPQKSFTLWQETSGKIEKGNAVNIVTGAGF